MSEKKYLDKTGLGYLWSKIKETFANKAEVFLYYTIATNHPSAETITFASLYNSLIEKFGTASVILKDTGYFGGTGFLTIRYKGGYYDVFFMDFTNHRIYNSEGSYLPGTTKISVIFEDAKDIITEDDLSNFITKTQTIVELREDNIAEVKEIVTQNHGALIKLRDYIYAPTYNGDGIPNYYACCAADEKNFYYLIVHWDDEEIETGSFSLEEVGKKIYIDDLTQL